jgi:pyrimidine deaminase RibD-like protein
LHWLGNIPDFGNETSRQARVQESLGIAIFADGTSITATVSERWWRAHAEVAANKKKENQIQICSIFTC